VAKREIRRWCYECACPLPPSLPPPFHTTSGLTAFHVLGSHGAVAFLRLLRPHAPLCLSKKRLESTNQWDGVS